MGDGGNCDSKWFWNSLIVSLISGNDTAIISKFYIYMHECIIYQVTSLSCKYFRS